MERIEAIIRPERVNLVKDALAEAGFTGLNVTPVTGRGAQVGIHVGGPRGVGDAHRRRGSRTGDSRHRLALRYGNRLAGVFGVELDQIDSK